jgi:integrase
MPQTKLISPIGTVDYVHLTTPDTAFNADGFWSIGIKVPTKSKEAKQLRELLDKKVDEALEQFESNKRSDPPYKIDGDDTLFRFKLKAVIRSRKTGQEWKTSVNVVDSRLQPVPKSVRIGTGSKVRVSYTTRLYQAPMGAGVAADLSGVQVIDLVEYSPNSSGFDKTDGFSAESIEADETESYSQAQTEQAESGDF